MERLGLFDKTFRPAYLLAGTNERVDATRDVVIGNQVAKRVFCKLCNEGWMRELDEAVVDILEGFYRRTLSPRDLSSTETRTLARWALKTGLAIANARGTDSQIHSRRLYLDAYNGTWHEGAVVFVSRPYSASETMELVSGTVPYRCGSSPSIAGSAIPLRSFLAAGALYENFVIGVAQCDSDFFRLAFTAGVHELLWPPFPPVMRIEEFTPPPRWVINSANVIMTGIGVVPRSLPDNTQGLGFISDPDIDNYENREWFRAWQGIRTTNAGPWY